VSLGSPCCGMLKDSLHFDACAVINTCLAEVTCEAWTMYLEYVKNTGHDVALELRHYALIVRLI